MGEAVVLHADHLDRHRIQVDAFQDIELATLGVDAEIVDVNDPVPIEDRVQAVAGYGDLLRRRIVALQVPAHPSLVELVVLVGDAAEHLGRPADGMERRLPVVLGDAGIHGDARAVSRQVSVGAWQGLHRHAPPAVLGFEVMGVAQGDAVIVSDFHEYARTVIVRQRFRHIDILSVAGA